MFNLFKKKKDEVILHPSMGQLVMVDNDRDNGYQYGYVREMFDEEFVIGMPTGTDVKVNYISTQKIANEVRLITKDGNPYIADELIVNKHLFERRKIYNAENKEAQEQ